MRRQGSPSSFVVGTEKTHVEECLTTLSVGTSGTSSVVPYDTPGSSVATPKPVVAIF